MPQEPYLPGKSRLAGIDAMRIFGSFMVVVSHSFYRYGYFDDPVYRLLYLVIGSFSHFTVPFFFIVAGYFIRQSIESGKRLRQIARRYVFRLTPLFLFWGAAYHILPYLGVRSFFVRDFSSLRRHFQMIVETVHREPFNFFFTWDSHLWFLSCLAVLTLALLVCAKLNLNRGLFVVAFVSYAFHMIVQPYSRFFHDATVLKGTSQLYSGFFYISLGYLLKLRKLGASFKQAVALIAAGMLLKMAECHVLLNQLSQFGPLNRDVMGMPILAVGMFLLAMSISRRGHTTALHRFGRYSLGIYAAHSIVHDKLYKIMPIDSLMSPVLGWAVGAVLTFGATLGVVMILARTPVIKKFVLTY